MGIFKISLFLDFVPSLKLSPPFFLIIITSTLSLIIAQDQDPFDSHKVTSPPPQASIDRTQTPKASPFNPSIAIFLGILTLIVCFTFLILLYAKHCRGGIAFMHNHNDIESYSFQRQNSGVHRTIVESLPTFKFASLRGQKDGLECAVCLNKFEPTEVLRLLPKCKHAFHVECLDTWLDIHSTCPLCRYRVEPEDILLVDHSASSNNSTTSSKLLSGVHTTPPPPPPPVPRQGRNRDPALLSRHSSGGESGSSSFLQVIVEQPDQIKRKSTTSLLSSKRSFDGLRSFNKKNGISNKTTSSRLSCTKSLDSSNESYIDQKRKDGLLLDARNNNHGRSILLPGVEENVVQPPPLATQEERGISMNSSGGEGGIASLWKAIVEPKTHNHRRSSTSLFGSKRSVDGGSSAIKKPNIIKKVMSPRLSGTRSLDPCSERYADVMRKDGLLALTERHRVSHKIIIAGPEMEDSLPRDRWSDVQPSDMLYLESEMILRDENSRLTGLNGSRSSGLRHEKGCNSSSSSSSSDDRKVISARSVSDMTGLSRFRSHQDNGRSRTQGNNVGGAITRLKAWIPNSKSELEKQQPSLASTSSNVV